MVNHERILQKLPADKFIRVHRSYIISVNAGQVRKKVMHNRGFKCFSTQGIKMLLNALTVKLITSEKIAFTSNILLCFFNG